MTWWKELLDSLATRGGTILVLAIGVAGGVFVVLHVLHHDPNNRELVSFAISLATGFVSALTLALTGGNRLANGKNENPNRTPNTEGEKTSQ